MSDDTFIIDGNNAYLPSAVDFNVEYLTQDVVDDLLGDQLTTVEIKCELALQPVAQTDLGEKLMDARHRLVLEGMDNLDWEDIEKHRSRR